MYIKKFFNHHYQFSIIKRCYSTKQISNHLYQELQLIMKEIIHLRQELEKNKKNNSSIQNLIEQKEIKKEHIISKLVHKILIDINSENLNNK